MSREGNHRATKPPDKEMKPTKPGCGKNGLCVGLFALAAFVGAEAPESHVLEVAVTDCSTPPRPLAGVSIAVVAKKPSPLLAEGFTDAAGKWTARVKAGTYRISVSLTGFQERARSVVVPVGRSEPSRGKPVTFELQPARHEVITIDDTCAIDQLQAMGRWTICARDLERIPFD
jgi:hypothetical protein